MNIEKIILFLGAIIPIIGIIVLILKKFLFFALKKTIEESWNHWQLRDQYKSKIINQQKSERNELVDMNKDLIAKLDKSIEQINWLSKESVSLARVFIDNKKKLGELNTQLSSLSYQLIMNEKILHKQYEEQHIQLVEHKKLLTLCTDQISKLMNMFYHKRNSKR